MPLSDYYRTFTCPKSYLEPSRVYRHVPCHSDPRSFFLFFRSMSPLLPCSYSHTFLILKNSLTNLCDKHSLFRQRSGTMRLFLIPEIKLPVKTSYSTSISFRSLSLSLSLPSPVLAADN